MRRRWALMLVALMCAALSGCQLARVDGAHGVGDRFAGMSLRVESIEETYRRYEQQPEDEIVMEGDAPFMDELMAWPVHENEQWPLIEPYLAALYEYEGENRTIGGGARGGCFSDVKQTVHASDDAEEYSQEATVYLIGDDEFNHDVGDTVIYLDSVYQRPDGSAYTIREDGGISGNIDGLTQSRTEETTTTVNGKTQRNTYRCSVSFQQVDEMTARLLEFDANNVLIGAQPIERPAQGQAIDLRLSASAAYALVEKTVIDRYTRQAKIVREICNGPFDGETIQCNLYYKGDHSIAKIIYLTLEQ